MNYRTIHFNTPLSRTNQSLTLNLNEPEPTWLDWLLRDLCLIFGFGHLLWNYAYWDSLWHLLAYHFDPDIYFLRLLLLKSS